MQIPGSQRTVRDVLLEEYVLGTKVNGRQSKVGEAGHLNTVLSNHLSKQDVDSIRTGMYMCMCGEGREAGQA